jgi:hypothetical protein
MNFTDLKQEHIELNLDDIFDEYGYINKFDADKYRQNTFVKTIKLTRTKNTSIKIGNNFLEGCLRLTNIDLSPLSNITQIGNYFLSKCSGLTNIDLSFLYNIERIGDCFLNGCSGLTNIDLSPLSNFTQIENCFLYNCSGLINIDLLPLSNVTQIGNNFLSHCSRLTKIDLSPLSNIGQIGGFFLSCCLGLTKLDLLPLSNVTQVGIDFLYGCFRLNYMIVNNNNNDKVNCIMKKIKEYNPNMELIIKYTLIFKTLNEDIEFILKDKNFTKELMNYLEIKFQKKNSHKVLLKKINKIKEEYLKNPSDEYLSLCVNNECIFTMEELKEIPKKKLIQLNEQNGKYYCFDILALREYIFKKKNNKYINPYTTIKFTAGDIDKILKTDIKKIKYFCE